MKTDEDVRTALEGAEVWQVVEILYQDVKTLLANDPDYFSDGKGNSIVATLRELEDMIGTTK